MAKQGRPKMSSADKVLNYLRRTKKRKQSYKEVAIAALKNPKAAMAVGQILKKIGREHGKALTRKVKAA